MERRSRFLETREAQYQNEEKEMFYDPAHFGKLYINPEVIPDNIQVGWFNKSNMNEPDYQNIKNKILEGWQVCSPEMFPSLLGPDVSDIFGASETRFIERYGKILMMIPKEVWARRQDRHNEETRSVMHQANVASAYLNEDARMPFVTTADHTSYGTPILM
jgi:hypothetical protein